MSSPALQNTNHFTDILFSDTLAFLHAME